MRVIIADDHPLFLDEVHLQLKRAFKGAEILAFSCFADVIAALIERPADLIILDHSMKGMGVEGMAQAVSAAGMAPVMVTSGEARPEDAIACIGAGARGFLPKTMDAQIFIDAIQILLHGGSYVPTEFVATARLPEPSPHPALNRADLSERESILLGLVGGGASNREIALQMNMRVPSVKYYLSNLFHRLGAKNRSQAAVIAAQLGLKS